MPRFRVAVITKTKYLYDVEASTRSAAEEQAMLDHQYETTHPSDEWIYATEIVRELVDED